MITNLIVALSGVLMLAVAFAVLYKTPPIGFRETICGGSAICMDLANVVAPGTHGDSRIPRKSESTISDRHLLVKQGVAADGVALCGAHDLPVGICTDTPDSGDYAAIRLLASCPATCLGIAAGAISERQPLYTAANGQIQTEPETAGTYYLVGYSIGSATGQGEQFEFEPCAPRRVTILAALSNVNGAIAALTFSPTPTPEEFNALRDACETLGDDLRSLTGAWSQPGFIKVLGS